MAKPRRFRRYLIILILLVVAAGAWFYYNYQNRPKPVFTTATIATGDVQQTVTATGTLQPVTSVEVGSQVSGLITEVLVDYNSPVKAGQLIAKIDPANYEQALRQAQADLASAQANADLVKLNTQRTAELRAQHLVAQQDLDQANANLAQANATLLTKQAALANAQVNLSRCSIYSPVDGIVLDRQVEVGKTVAASLNTPTLFVIANDLTKMEINAAISEADIGSVRDGQTVDFNVDAFPDRQFHGRVIQIRNTPTTTSNVVTYQTIISVDNRDLRLMPGMTANVAVVIASSDHVLLVPNSALRVRMPEALLPPAPAAGPAAAEAAATGPRRPSREEYRQLMKDAGLVRGSGPPSPEVIAKMRQLAQDRGFALPERGEGHHPGGDAAAPVTTHTIYKLTGTAEHPLVEPVTVKLSITDGINSQVVSGLQAGDVVITSVFMPAGAPTGPATNPFSGMGRRRF